MRAAYQNKEDIIPRLQKIVTTYRPVQDRNCFQTDNR